MIRVTAIPLSLLAVLGLQMAGAAPASAQQGRMAGASSPSERIQVRDHAACDGTADDWAGLQEALDLAAATGRLLDFGAASCVASRRLVAADGSISIAALPNAGSIRFTNPRSAGFAFSLRPYRQGKVDRVSISGLTIVAGAIHDDPALKIVWQDRIPNGERMLRIDSVTVRPDSFGTHSFAQDLWVDAAFNGTVTDFFALGNASAIGTAIFVNQSISITFARPNVNWRAVAAHFTTGHGGKPQPQSEGHYLDHPVFYNVNKCVRIDGRSSTSLNMIDFSWAHGHCAANQGVRPQVFDISLLGQSHFSGGTFYAYLDQATPLADLRSVSDSDFTSNYFLSMAGRGTGGGLKFAAASVGNRIVANRLVNFATCLEFAASNDTANWYSANQFNDCAQPVIDRGAANTDGGNGVASSSTVLKRNTLVTP